MKSRIKQFHCNPLFSAFKGFAIIFSPFHLFKDLQTLLFCFTILLLTIPPSLPPSNQPTKWLSCQQNAVT